MLPRKVQRNQPITADLLNNIIDSIRECQIQSGVGYSFSRNAGGTTLSIGGQKTTQQAIEDTPCPFEVTLSATTAGTYKIAVGAGTINGLVAGNSIQCLSTETTPLSTAVSGESFVTANISSSSGVITSWELSIESEIEAISQTTPAPPSSFQWPLYFIRNGVKYRLIECDSPTFYAYQAEWVPISPSSATDPVFDIYWTWAKY